MHEIAFYSSQGSNCGLLGINMKPRCNDKTRLRQPLVKTSRLISCASECIHECTTFRFHPFNHLMHHDSSEYQRLIAFLVKDRCWNSLTTSFHLSDHRSKRLHGEIPHSRLDLQLSFKLCRDIYNKCQHHPTEFRVSKKTPAQSDNLPGSHPVLRRTAAVDFEG